SIVCFGGNDHGQLGDGTTTPRPLPTATLPLPSGEPPAAVAAGAAHTCAVDSVGNAFCWGRGDDGQLGDGGTADSAAPVAVIVPAGAPLTAIAAGAAHTCAVDSAGGVWCWGRGSDGQLGLG